MRRIIVVSLSLVSGERNLIHKPLATCCNFSSCTCTIFVDTREIYLELNSGGSELRCSSDCGSRVVRKASEGNLESPTVMHTIVVTVNIHPSTRIPTQSEY